MEIAWIASILQRVYPNFVHARVSRFFSFQSDNLINLTFCNLELFFLPPREKHVSLQRVEWTCKVDRGVPKGQKYVSDNRDPSARFTISRTFHENSLRPEGWHHYTTLPVSFIHLGSEHLTKRFTFCHFRSTTSRIFRLDHSNSHYSQSTAAMSLAKSSVSGSKKISKIKCHFVGLYCIIRTFVIIFCIDSHILQKKKENDIYQLKPKCKASDTDRCWCEDGCTCVKT